MIGRVLVIVLAWAAIAWLLPIAVRAAWTVAPAILLLILNGRVHAAMVRRLLP